MSSSPDSGGSPSALVNQDLEPIVSEDLTGKSLIIFTIITAPLLLIFLCVTCYCRCQRRKRKFAEKEERRKKQAQIELRKAQYVAEQRVGTE